MHEPVQCVAVLTRLGDSELEREETLRNHAEVGGVA